MSQFDTTLTERQRYWHDHLERCRLSGLSVAAYAAEHDLSAAAMYHFRRVFQARDPLSQTTSGVAPSPGATATPPNRFVRATVASATLPCRAHLGNGVTVEFGVSSDDLGTVLSALARLP